MRLLVTCALVAIAIVVGHGRSSGGIESGLHALRERQRQVVDTGRL